MRRVALVGTAPSTRQMANELPDGVELWGLNSVHEFLTRPADRWFQIHPKNRMERKGAWGRGQLHSDFLKNFFGPVYMDREYEEVPGSLRYPYERVFAFFGREYLTSTTAYMLALAIMEDFEEIHLYGMDLAVGSEYSSQRPCAEYYVGQAEARGIIVVIPDASTLMKGALYPNRDMYATYVGGLKAVIIDPDQYIPANNTVSLSASPVGPAESL